MARLDIDWEQLRAEYEIGTSQNELAKKYDVARRTIQKRIAKEGWVQDVSDALKRMTEAKVAGVVAGSNPEKKAEALDAEAAKRAEIVLKHRREWEEHTAMTEGIEDFEKAKLAKIMAETLRIRQDGERRAWNLDKEEPANQQTTIIKLGNE